MSNEIVVAFNNAFPDGPQSDPANPDKSAIRHIGEVVQSSVTASSSGILRADTLAQLNTTPGAQVNAAGQVFNDPTPANNGEYRWTGSAWSRVGPLIDTTALQGNIDKANAWSIFANSGPLLLDASGVVDGNAYLYVPTRKFYSKGINAIDLDVGTVATGFPGYERIAIGRFRETGGSQFQFVYYDLDDTASPVKVTQYNTFPPSDRPARIVELITIASNGFYSSPLRVVEISGTDGGIIAPMGAIVHEKDAILIPSFYQYHNTSNFGVVAPPDGTSRYFEFAGTPDNLRRYFYDNMADVINSGDATKLKEVVGNGYPRQEGSRIYKLATKYPTNNSVVGHNGFRIAKNVRNMWKEGKYPDTVAIFYTGSGLGTVIDSPTELAAQGFPRAVRSTGTDLYYGGGVARKAKDVSRGFGRFYLHTTAANNFGTGPYIVQFWSEEAGFLGNIPLTLEKKINSNVAMYSGQGVIPAGASYWYIGASGTIAGTHSIAGGQFWQGEDDEVWISRTDYPADFGSSVPIFGKDMWLVQGRKMPIYPANLIGLRDDDDNLRGGLLSLRGIDNYPHFTEGRDQFIVDPDQCGSTGQLTFRRPGLGGEDSERFQANLNINVSSASKSGSPNILMIGDSLTNGGLPRQVDNKLRAMGVTANWIGTIRTTDNYNTENATTGLLAEGRGGRNFADYIYSVVSGRVSPVTDVAAYIAADKPTKIGKNPFLRAAVGGDPADRKFNGYIFDIAPYLTNYSLPNPDIVIIGLGTNDVYLGTDAQAVQQVSDGVRVMMLQIRLALPNAKIAWWMPTRPKSYLADTVYGRQIKAIRSACSWILQNGDANMKIIPTWAHMSPEIGWWLNANPTVTDNVARALIADIIHSGPEPAPLREQVAETLFAYIANQL